MLNVLIRVVSGLGSAMSAWALLEGGCSKYPLWLKVPIVSVLILALAVVIADVVIYRKSRPRSYGPGDPEITQYLRDFLLSGGRAAILSRDLSWAQNGAATEALRTKAAKGELLLMLGRETPVSLELRTLGAEIHNYGPSQFVPRSRFTIVDFGSAGPRLAIGIVEAQRHIIREFDASHPFMMALANDLVELAKISASLD